MQNTRYEEVVAHAGYEGQENYLYLETNGPIVYIKPANYEQKKTRKYKKQIGRIENMVYDAEEDCFACTEGQTFSSSVEVAPSRGHDLPN